MIKQSKDCPHPEDGKPVKKGDLKKAFCDDGVREHKETGVFTNCFGLPDIFRIIDRCSAESQE